MKQLYSILFCFNLLLLSIATKAQVQRGFSFQGYARTITGTAIASQSVTVRFTIYPKGSTADFTEEQTVTTDAYGVFQLTVGSTALTNFSNINFAAKDYYLKVETKAFGSDYSTISDTQLLAVPYSKSADNGVPVGTILPFGGSVANVPPGYLLCNGQSVAQTDYPNLYKAIGNAWGTSGTNFNVPDLRGVFLRGVDGGRAQDPDRTSRTASNTGGNTGDAVGSYQGDQYKGHNHGGSTGNAGNHGHNTNAGGGSGNGSVGLMQIPNSGNTPTGFDSSNGEVDLKNLVNIIIYPNGDHNHSIGADGGTETRPKNANVYYIIKY
jgi:hypothetical protein